GLLQHAPHGLDVVAGEAPVAARLQVPEAQLAREAELHPHGAVAHLARHELAAAAGRVVHDEPAHSGTERTTLGLEVEHPLTFGSAPRNDSTDPGWLLSHPATCGAPVSASCLTLRSRSKPDGASHSRAVPRKRRDHSSVTRARKPWPLFVNWTWALSFPMYPSAAMKPRNSAISGDT